jgi:hypothetical protein
MIRKWTGQTVVRLYPAELRAAKGDELVGTLLDAGDASLAAFLTQLVSLIIGGLAARSRNALSQPLDQIASDTVRWGAVITVASSMTTIVVEYVHWGGGIGWATITSWSECLAPTLILAMFIFGQDRATGVTGLSWCVVEAWQHPQLPLSDWISLMVLPIVGFGLMTIAPRRPREPLRGLLLIPVLAWAFFRWTELGQQSGAGYLLPVITAAMFLPIKPTLTLGTAVSWSLLAAFYITIPETHYVILSIAMLSCTPIAIALIALTRRALPER